MVHYFRQLCNDYAVLNIKSQSVEERDAQKGDRQPIQCAQVATERKHRWALPPPVAWIISVLCWLSVSLHLWVTLSAKSNYHLRLFPQKDFSLSNWLRKVAYFI